MLAVALIVWIVVIPVLVVVFAEARAIRRRRRQ